MAKTKVEIKNRTEMAAKIDLEMMRREDMLITSDRASAYHAVARGRYK